MVPPSGGLSNERVPWSFSARRRRFGSPRPPPAAADAPVSPTPSSADGDDAPRAVRLHPDGGPCRLRVLAHVGERLPDGREQVLEHEVVDGGVERARERQFHLEAHHLVELAHEVGDVVADAAAVLSHPELVDGGAHLGDDLVDLRHGAAELVRRGLGQAGRQPLQGEAQREEALDHRVVEIAGHPIAVLVDRRPPHPVMEAGVLDRDAGGLRERPDQCLVVEGELGPPHLLGQIEVPVHLVAQFDRRTEEGGHGRVVGREPEAVGMVADLGDAQDLGVGDEQPEDPATGRAGTDPGLFLRGQPDGDELRQGLLLLVEDPERPVARPRHGARLLDDMPQDVGQFEVRLDQERRLEDPAELGRILDPAEWHSLEPTHAQSCSLRCE